MRPRHLDFTKNLLFHLPIFLCVALSVPFQSHSQSNNLGSPPIKNFTKKEYRAGTQNWQITQDKRGVVYAANNQGLLEFDGSHWRLFPLDNGTSLRSLAVAVDGTIYVGSQGEVGYFAGSENGTFTFHSLNDHLQVDRRKFEDVWEIIIDGEVVYFLSWRQIMKWENGAMSTPLVDEGYLFLFKINDRFYLQKADGSFGYFEKNLNTRFNKLATLNSEITSMLAYHPDTLLVTTDLEGIFQLVDDGISPWTTSDDLFFKANRIYCSGMLPDGNLVFGTTSYGMVVMDKNKRILQQVSKANGLQNNTVLSVFTNQNGNIWLGLDNGITFVQANSALTEFFPDGDLEGTCYALATHQGQLYAGTNTGVYQIPWKPYYLPSEKTGFKVVPNSEGQVWSLEEHHGQLLMGHTRGPFMIENGRAKQLADLIGVWKYVSFQDTYLLAGHYGGLVLFEQLPNELNYIGPLDGALTESCRLLANENGIIWVAHPYRGIFKIDLSVEKKQASYTFFDSQNGLPSNFNNYLFQLNNKLVITAEKGVYKYDPAQNGLVLDEDFNKIFGRDAWVKYLRQDQKGNIWYVADDEVGVLLIQDLAFDKKVSKMPIPELSNKLVGGFEFILPVDEHHVLVATEKGVIHFDPSRYQPSNTPPVVVLSEVWLNGERDSLLFGGYPKKAGPITKPELTYLQNALEFIFSSTDHEGQEFVKYAYRLEGAEEAWSSWDSHTSLNINNLRPGNYTMLIKAMNKSGIESQPVHFEFTITPPWYASTLAYTFYGMVLVGAFIGLAFFQNKKHEKEKAFLENTHLQEQEKKEALVQESKEKINLLKRQKLEAEVLFKNQELAAATMNLLQKSEMLTSIQTSLERMKNQDGKRDDIYGEINRLLKLVKNETDLSGDWERFSKHFDQVHSDFLRRLGELFPGLSPNDFKLSAYLRMNLSTKEIAALMNISIRGVEASRYRLRKRLGLGTEENLTEFLMKL